MGQVPLFMDAVHLMGSVKWVCRALVSGFNEQVQWPDASPFDALAFEETVAVRSLAPNERWAGMSNVAGRRALYFLLQEKAANANYLLKKVTTSKELPCVQMVFFRFIRNQWDGTIPLWSIY